VDEVGVRRRGAGAEEDDGDVDRAGRVSGGELLRGADVEIDGAWIALQGLVGIGRRRLRDVHGGVCIRGRARTSPRGGDFPRHDALSKSCTYASSSAGAIAASARFSSTWAADRMPASAVVTPGVERTNWSARCASVR